MENSVLNIMDFSAYYNEKKVLGNINLDFEALNVTSILGPSGCGKTTLIRCINRMHELVPKTRIQGQVLLNGINLYSMQPEIVRKKIGMVFQNPNPFPNMSIYENVISGYNLNGIKLTNFEKDRIVEETLQKVALWDEVKSDLHDRGSDLSGGQQQRLCMARALAMEPEILLLDEPTSSLDPKAVKNIEKLIYELKKSVTIILVTHSIGQAARVSDFTAFLYHGELVEYGRTKTLFTSPGDKRTEEYLTGRFS